MGFDPPLSLQAGWWGVSALHFIDLGGEREVWSDDAQRAHFADGSRVTDRDAQLFDDVRSTCAMYCLTVLAANLDGEEVEEPIYTCACAPRCDHVDGEPADWIEDDRCRSCGGHPCASWCGAKEY